MTQTKISASEFKAHCSEVIDREVMLERWDHDPRTSAWARFKVQLFKILPIEGQL